MIKRFQNPFEEGERLFPLSRINLRGKYWKFMS